MLMLSSKCVIMKDKLLKENEKYNKIIKCGNYDTFYRFIINDIIKNNLNQNDKNIFTFIANTIINNINKDLDISDFNDIDRLSNEGKEFINNILDSINTNQFLMNNNIMFCCFMYKFILIYSEIIYDSFDAIDLAIPANHLLKHKIINKLNNQFIKLMDSYTFNNNKLSLTNKTYLSFDFYYNIFMKNKVDELFQLNIIVNDAYLELKPLIDRKIAKDEVSKKITEQIQLNKIELENIQKQIEIEQKETELIKTQRIEAERLKIQQVEREKELAKYIQEKQQIEKQTQRIEKQKQLEEESEETDLDSLSSVSSESDASESEILPNKAEIKQPNKMPSTMFPVPRKSQSDKLKENYDKLVDSINEQMKSQVNIIKEKYKNMKKADKKPKSQEILDNLMNTEIDVIKDKYTTMKKDAKKEYNENIKSISKNKTTQNKRKSIPKVLKNQVWDKYIGREKGIGKCCCCDNEIDSRHFECGHIVAVAKGGEDSLVNLRPVCSLCNKSMSTMDMREFCKKYMNKNII